MFLWTFIRPLFESNDCHTPAGSAQGGEFCAKPGGAGGARPRIIRVDTVREAIPLILAGKSVELRRTRQVNTLLTRLGRMALEAARLGQKAPDYDLCKVSVRGTNLFCADRLRTAADPDGVPRLKMPQFKGEPVPGTRAAALTPNRRGRVDGSAAFLDHLTSLGIASEKTKIRTSKLKASQAELSGPRVAGLMTSGDFDPRQARIFVSRDHYIIDGHHRWAAAVGLDAKDGRLGDVKMKVYKIDAPIAEILHVATTWTAAFGLKGRGV